MPECMICGKPICERFWVCDQCEHAYPVLAKPYREWPEWAKYMQRDERRRRKRTRREVRLAYASESRDVDRMFYGE